MENEPRCPGCGETRLVEKVCRPIWASKGQELWFCAVCSKTFLHTKAATASN